MLWEDLFEHVSLLCFNTRLCKVKRPLPYNSWKINRPFSIALASMTVRSIVFLIPAFRTGLRERYLNGVIKDMRDMISSPKAGSSLNFMC